MAARRLFHESTNSSTTNQKRDSIIDELPPEETEKMGYVWVVKGTLTEEEEKQTSTFGSLPDIESLPINEFSTCNLAKEKVHELIVPFDQWGEAPGKPEHNRSRETSEDFKLYIPSFVRQMHSLFSRPPELIRQDTSSIQQILEQMPNALADRPSYIQHPSRLLDLTPRSILKNEEPLVPKTSSDQEPPEPYTSSDQEPSEPDIKSDQEPEKEQEEKPQNVSPMKYEDLNATYADPEIEFDEGEIFKQPFTQVKEPSGEEPFIRKYILKKVEDLENKLRSVNDDINGSKDRNDQLQYQIYEMEILKLMEKISKADTPSETDVARLEMLTNRLKKAQGKKAGESH